MFRGKQYFEVLVFFFAQIFEHCFSAVRLFSVSLRLKVLSWPKYQSTDIVNMIDISNILGKKEGLHLEAKSARGGFPDSFWESYSAFANTDGGVILLGVEEKPDHSLYVTDGLTDAEKMKNDFWNLVNNHQKVSHNIVTNRLKMSTIEPL